MAGPYQPRKKQTKRTPGLVDSRSAPAPKMQAPCQVQPQAVRLNTNHATLTYVKATSKTSAAAAAAVNTLDNAVRDYTADPTT